MGSMSWVHWLIVLVVVVVVFGTKKLRNAGGDLGAAIRSFRKGLNETDEEAGKLGKPDAAANEHDRTHQNEHR